jgi:hypothetical protein
VGDAPVLLPAAVVIASRSGESDEKVPFRPDDRRLWPSWTPVRVTFRRSGIHLRHSDVVGLRPEDREAADMAVDVQQRRADLRRAREDHRVRRREALATGLEAARWLLVALLVMALLGIVLEGPLIPGWSPHDHRYELILLTPAQMTLACVQVAWRAGALVWALPRWARVLRTPGPSATEVDPRFAALLAATVLPLLVPWF